jgi:hypothetical protein
MNDSPPDPEGEVRRSRQKTTLILLAGVLFLAGFVVIAFLKRIPLPARLAIGVADMIMASVLLVFLRQNFPGGRK